MPALLLVLALLALAAPAAHASPGSGPTAAVSLGDSYISGEAGRWAGNSVNPAPDHDKTDRGAVYSDGNGCHRADVAEIMSAQLPVAERINLACSGAQTRNIFRAASGGSGQNEEAPQADQLLAVARAKDVRLVIVSIGGNDLGFASIIAACLQAYVAQTGPCKDGQQAGIEAKIAKAKADVMKAIDEIRAVMAEAGYRPGDFRLVLQTYPSVIPRASEIRYATPPEREAHGCPFYDEDLDWARDTAAPSIGGMVKTAAAARQAELVDLIDAFQGHEFCSKTTQEATPFAPPTPAGSDWGRFLGASTVQQGDLQEAFHPNEFGHTAFGACLSQVFAASTPGTFACSGRAGIEPGGVTLTRRSTFTSRAVRATAPRLRLAVRRPGRRCVAVRVTAAGRPVRGVRVRLAKRSKRTGRRGRATFCRLAPGRYHVVATRTGFRAAKRSVRMRA